MRTTRACAAAGDNNSAKIEIREIRRQVMVRTWDGVQEYAVRQTSLATSFATGHYERYREHPQFKQERHMRTSVTLGAGAVLLTVGYVLGTMQAFSPSALFAQAGQAKKGDKKSDASKSVVGAPGVDISDETKAKIK